jgi:hypothetical protein
MHPATRALLRHFEYEHLSPKLREISQLFHDLAWKLAHNDGLDGAELTVALRKLLESKDCAVRAAL